MATLTDLKPLFSRMTQSERVELIRQIRFSRRSIPSVTVRKQRATKASAPKKTGTKRSAKSILGGLTPEQARALLAELATED